MQRIGRVDRRMNPAIEEALIRDHPEVAASRGKVSFWNFLPPDELNVLLTLYTKVTQKTLMISKTLGIEGKKCTSSEPFGQVSNGFKRGSGPSGLNLRLQMHDAAGVVAR